MGVTGLWKLIEPCGAPVPVETLEGKILAVDISIWLHQVVKGFQDSKGSALANAHLLGLFHRLCKLLYYRVRPVFVFDGCVPQLKRDTIARRQQQRGKLNTEADRIQAILLQSLAKEKVVQQALGVSAATLLKSPVKRLGKAARADKDIDDMFKLPELPASTAAAGSKDEDAPEEDTNESSFCSCPTDDYNTTATGEDDSSFDESNPRYSYNTNLQAIDVRSRHFLDLPADVRHDILVDIKETRKQSSWGRLHELPSHSDDFSSFQMKRLLKRRAVQESLEEAEQEMGGRTLTYAELQNFFTEEGIVAPTALEKGSKQICSDENTRFLLVRDLKKKLGKAPPTTIMEVEVEVEEEEDKPKTDEKARTPSTSMLSAAAKSEKEADVEDDVKPSTSKQSTAALGEEYDADLAMAIAMSLDDTNNVVYSERDYDAAGNLKLNREQRKQLQNAAVGPARAYMIEYGGMNDEEVQGIMDTTQLQDDDVDDELMKLAIAESLMCNTQANAKPDLVAESVPEQTQGEELTLQVDDTDSELEVVEAKETPTEKIAESEEWHLRVSDATDSDTDSDLEEVTEDISTISTISTISSGRAAESKRLLEIVLDPKEVLNPTEDIFADIFEEKAEDHTEEGEEKKVEINDDVEKLEKSDAKNLCLTPNSVKKSSDILGILDELKKQAVDVKNINLEDIEIGKSPVVLISDDEHDLTTADKAAEGVAIKAEVIEIVDSDDNVPLSKSPKFNTPSKSKVISEYFETNYVIKRTPDKPAADAEEVVPKVKSPFFVNKTPSSSRKHSAQKSDRGDSPTQAKKRSKAAKTLFETGAQGAGEDDGEPVAKKAPINTEDLINEAAEVLRSQRTEEELRGIAANLARERNDLETERNRQDRMGMSISQRMNVDCQELLRLFGIPYIVAPMEAEAQCAFLDAIELTNGTITDDSDIWLFGGRTVYKNFFAQNKHVLEFRATEIEKSFNCDRKKLIQLACLVGSDYTTGVHGIGAVTALEILASFSSSSTAAKEAFDGNDAISTVVTTLSKFRDWWLAHKSTAMPPGSSARLALQKKLKNIELHEGFPSTAVVEAYLTPKVDDCKDAFSWGQPDVESIREFARKSFGWTTAKTDNILMPVIKKLNEKRTQATIRNYFSVKSAISVRELKVSKRVQKAIDTMSGKPGDEPTAAAKPVRKTRAKRKQAVAEAQPAATNSVVSSGEDELPLAPSGSKVPQKRTRKTANIPETKEVIPQREKDLAQMRKNKEKAAQILKKSAAASRAATKKKSNS